MLGQYPVIQVQGNFNKLTRWPEITAAVDAPGLHFHDLRHTGNTLASAGTALRDLMARMGHDSPRAALIYQHTTDGADRAIADRLDAALAVIRPEATADLTG